MKKFEIISDYKPSGGFAFRNKKRICDGIKKMRKIKSFLVLLVPKNIYNRECHKSSSKAFIGFCAKQKGFTAQLYSEMKSFFPNNCVEYFVSYYDYYTPEAYVPRTDTYIEKESSINEQIDR